MQQVDGQVLSLLNSLVLGQAELAARVDRILIDTLTPCPLLIALGDIYARGVTFLAADALAASEGLRVEAEGQGDRLPDLPREMDRAGITDANALGKYFGSLEGRGIERCVTRTSGGFVWSLV